MWIGNLLIKWSNPSWYRRKVKWILGGDWKGQFAHAPRFVILGLEFYWSPVR